MPTTYFIILNHTFWSDLVDGWNKSSSSSDYGNGGGTKERNTEMRRRRRRRENKTKQKKNTKGIKMISKLWITSASSWLNVPLNTLRVHTWAATGCPTLCKMPSQASQHKMSHKDIQSIESLRYSLFFWSAPFLLNLFQFTEHTFRHPIKILFLPELPM